MARHKRDTAYRAGRTRNGWCCTVCHRMFPHHSHPRRVFAALSLHRIVRHRRLPERWWTGRTCHLSVQHATGRRQVQVHFTWLTGSTGNLMVNGTTTASNSFTLGPAGSV